MRRVSEFALAASLLAVSIVAVSMAAGLMANPPGDFQADARATAAQSGAESGAVRLRIDHLPVAVGDLAAAEETFRDRLGFTIKPGRLHADSVNNLHLKFRDGSSLELITASEPKSSTAREYLAFLRGGDGGAFLALSDRDDEPIERLQPRIDSLGFDTVLHRPRIGQWITFRGHPELRSIFLLSFKRRPVDGSDVLSHPNGAEGIESVWFEAPPDGALVHLLLGLGAHRGGRRTSPWDGREAEVFELETGRINRLDPGPGARSGRPIVGVSLLVDDYDRALAAVSSIAHVPSSLPGQDPCRLWLPEQQAHGLVLELLTADCRR